MQVDFGAGPPITDVHTGEIFKTWFFVMTLAWSRHQYAESCVTKPLPPGLAATAVLSSGSAAQWRA